MNEDNLIRRGAANAVTEEFSEPRRPSLAMVYAPRQRFRDLFEPAEALLRRGTLFRELYKPFQPGGRPLC